VYVISFFFFQAEDGIRDRNVTGVQTCALPISNADGRRLLSAVQRARHPAADSGCAAQVRRGKCRKPAQWQRQAHRRERQRLYARSEEHTSELQSRFDLVCRLLLEKKKKQKTEK